MNIDVSFGDLIIFAVWALATYAVWTIARQVLLGRRDDA